MADQNDNRTREEVLEAVLEIAKQALLEERRAREAAEDEVARLKAEKVKRCEKQLREALPGALARALWETRIYHRSVLTGRCCVAAGW